MAIDKVLIDTNICLDAANRRKPFAANAIEILSRSENGEYTGLVAAHSFDTIFYFLSKKYSRASAYEALKGLRKTIRVAAITQQIIDAAISQSWKDFEDAIHYETATSLECDAIITRNKKDFKASDMTIYSPAEFLEQIK